jgi:hypothetical protein
VLEWLTVEVFDEAHAAWVWRDANGDVLVAAAIASGAVYWEWHEHRYGVALELCFPTLAGLEAFRGLPAVRAALDRAPDPQHGVIIYRGRGGGAGSRVPRRPKPLAGAGAAELPEPQAVVAYDDPSGTTLAHTTLETIS